MGLKKHAKKSIEKNILQKINSEIGDDVQAFQKTLYDKGYFMALTVKDVRNG